MKKLTSILFLLWLLLQAAGAEYGVASPKDYSATIPAGLFHDTQLQIEELEKHKFLLEGLANENKWPPIPHVRLLSFGDQSDVVTIIRQRLIQLGDLTFPESTLSDKTFDFELRNALIHFQRRHGLKADGILGPATRRTLNVSPLTRINQITINIERLKAFTPESDRYILVNIPDYRLYLFERGRPVLEMKTIVGKKKRKTPVFETTINRIVVNPSWHVPKSIAFKDIVPELENNPDYLKKHNLLLVEGWGDNKKILTQAELDIERLYTGDNYQRFWEPPSNNGTLGSVKFLTSGPYSIYLHDTSAKRLFAEENRAFSSGCIRVEKPRQLADELMRMSNGWKSNQLEPLFKNEERHLINMPTAIPLYVNYHTAFIDENGLNFRRDIYKRDLWEFAQYQKSQ